MSSKFTKAAKLLGQKGGQAKSEKKTKAVRRNAKLPRKKKPRNGK